MRIHCAVPAQAKGGPAPSGGVEAVMYALTLLMAALPLSPGLESVLDGGRFVGTPKGFQMITLSHVADGCAARAPEDPAAARACLERVYRRARRLPADTGLAQTHLLLILGAGDRTGPCLDPQRHQHLAESLAGGSLSDPDHHLPSYPGRRERWPADQAATLAGLHRYDHFHQGQTLPPVAAAFRLRVEGRAIDPATQLPWSEVNGRGTGKWPRGCALSYSIRYLAEADPDLARRWWAPYRAQYLVDRGVLVGFREWPPGVERRADVDSGPIVNGVGAAATAFGIGAAQAMGEELLAWRLTATAHTVGALAAEVPALARASQSTMAEAILFWATAPQVHP